ncbi:hypothetical protein A5784_16795 [Mycobacterium sp. 852013-50091_SCH5140682]|uniref:aromatic-ring-hydroxylating dioxygenase subunit beta n=1 Tax=Mycobacterium sp. 852013-50091_SCH5140682 TaxID=1834109 RepID=UPI0007EB412D|nr:aromatic-ring-hydroxylating dioxygenase subunit beta [Mycobacterium sp. 852013-50091_SCH5140682]OBC01775.1 hypothetical protein A5784_16795 [Mycobacterium sp. 852013-50091_SCH5140682]
MTVTPAGDDPAAVSRYINPELYARIVRDAHQWDLPVTRPDRLVQRGCEALLYREARLLDEGKFEEWLDMFVPELVYWVPATPGGGQPDREVTIAFDDRRRLEDRIIWLRNAFIWSQIPRSRTVRSISNIEVIDADDGDYLIRSVVNIAEVRGGHRDNYAGYCIHRVRSGEGGLKIVSKQVNLVDSDLSHHGSSIIL